MAQSLQDQDLILIGQQVIRFEIVKDAEEGLGPARVVGCDEGLDAIDFASIKPGSRVRRHG